MHFLRKKLPMKNDQSMSKLTAAFLPNYNNSIEMNEIVYWWNVTFQTDFVSIPALHKILSRGSNILFMGSCTPRTELVLSALFLP